jgi:tripartite-type tricarboxylate transporter receptor subunit TctC
MAIQQWLLATALVAGLSGTALAQAKWPEKTVKVVVNFAPGGSTDNAARPYADRLSRALGQQFIIENRSGASGTIGVEGFVRSEPDGYTLLVTGSPVLMVVPQARKVPWDPLKDLVPVAHLSDYMLPITVNPSLPVNSIKELQAYSKAHPGKLNCGSAGLGTLTHLTCESLKNIAGIDNLHVPYRGGADALNDFLAGVTQIHSEPNVMPHVAAGKAKLLAIVDRERHPDYPNVPLISELYPEFAMVGWFGLFAPVGTPPAMVKRINEAVTKVSASPDMQKYFLSIAQRVTSGTPEQFSDLIKRDWDYYGKLVKKMNLKLE